MYCSIWRVLLLKWSRSGPRSHPEESLSITSCNRGSGYHDDPLPLILHPRCRAHSTWCWPVLPPFCVMVMLTSSSSSRIFWQYSESFSKTYPLPAALPLETSQKAASRLRVDTSCSYLHGESPPGDADDRAAVEIVGELVAVHRGAHEDQLQVGPPHHHILQDGQQEVGLDAALMDLRGRRAKQTTLTSLRSRTPVVQYSRRVHSPDWFSIRIWYPHSDD
ncbi:hypothetical protein EYF80_031105 [Liparis tanakae]|uniref:Uncharacterized protein n=1 Tax=Liparis tanakae TaxID=230148 RepID=A0A4Z2GZF4_9TELE|nr:hypothetical protein EYF80_031105 [Liparis tanakae]